MLTLVWSAAALVLGAGVGCGDDDDDDGAQHSGLAATCAEICDNVLRKCGLTAAGHSQCLSGCQYLEVAQVGCVDETAAYLACLGGATSVECGGNGQYVLLSPPSCAAQQRAYDTCRGGGPPLAVCLAQPLNNPTCAAAKGPPNAVFCLGLPAGCQAPAGSLIGIGLYCCP